MITHKICKQCNQMLEIQRFSTSSNVKDGYENKCKTCRQTQRKKYEITCGICDETFFSSKKDAKFCGSKCIGESRKNQISIPCSHCGELLDRPISLITGKEYIYCNQKCRTEHLKEIMKGKGNPNYNRVKTNCGFCKKDIYEIPFKVNTQKHIYCSDECYREHRRILMTGELNHSYSRVTLNCEVCGKGFERKPGEAKKSNKKYCSRSCYEKALTKYNFDRKSGEMYPCSICGKEIYATKNTRGARKYFYCSTECKVKGWSKYFSGSNNPNWRGEMTYQERAKSRLLDGYKAWRSDVYERDNYTCQCCFDNRGGNLVAHHLNSYDKHKELRLDVNNGITLCKKCHGDFHHKYGYGNNTKQQFDEWLSNSNTIRTVN